MRRRALLRRGSAGLATVTTLPVAGCTGDGDTGNEDRDLGDPMADLAEDSVAGVDVVGAQSRTDGEFIVVTVTLENVGDRTTDLRNYQLLFDVYDADGNGLEHTTWWEYPGGPTVGPGETATAQFRIRPEGATPDRVARYEIEFWCGDGVYCE